ncbi:MAG: hypothetical protein NTV51_10955 [Verrucomicrobia bacterium]|nr:hypothetical protein [Verrucomicrobiota bacterium]
MVVKGDARTGFRPGRGASKTNFVPRKTMKIYRVLPLLLSGVALLAASCSSGHPASRADYVSGGFGSVASRRNARAAEIRKLHPDLSEKEVSRQVELEFPDVKRGGK